MKYKSILLFTPNFHQPVNLYCFWSSFRLIQMKQYTENSNLYKEPFIQHATLTLFHSLPSTHSPSSPHFFFFSFLGEMWVLQLIPWQMKQPEWEQEAEGLSQSQTRLCCSFFLHSKHNFLNIQASGHEMRKDSTLQILPAILKDSYWYFEG